MESDRMDILHRLGNAPMPGVTNSGPTAAYAFRHQLRRVSYQQGKHDFARRFRMGNQQGLTLVELIVTVAILAILASVAYPIARFQIQRQKEQVLRDDLWTMRRAIDKYKDASDRGAIRTSIDSFGYPPDLDTLVNGVDVQGHHVKFLRAIPVDPMTGKKDWVLRSMQDDPDSDSWGGQNVFDVHSNSQGTALDGTKYSTW